MLSATQKNSILNSYSNVLCDILNKNFDKIEDILSSFEKINDNAFFEKLATTPMNLAEYKKVISDCNKQLGKCDELESFFMQVLNRKYGYLLRDIILLAEKKIRKFSNKKIIVIKSCDILDEEIKEEVKKALKSQGIEAELQFKKNDFVEKGAIEFIAGSKICVLKLQDLLNKVLSANCC